MLLGVQILILVVTFAMLFREGLWTNLLNLIIVITSALLAVNFFEPLANRFEAMEPANTYWFDFLSLWGVFVLSQAVLRYLADLLSKTQVRFPPAVDKYAGAALGLWAGWVFVCFFTLTLHTAPTARDSFGGSFLPKPEHRTFLGFAPDRQWLAFVQTVSRGGFATSPPAGVPATDGYNVFDPYCDFILRYAERRARFEEAPDPRVHRLKQ